LGVKEDNNSPWWFVVKERSLVDWGPSKGISSVQ